LSSVRSGPIYVSIRREIKWIVDFKAAGRLMLMPKQTANIQLRNTEQRTNIYRWYGKVFNITYSECAFVALVIQQVIRIRTIILLFLVYLVLPQFSSLSH
jgi:hypothetical protein